MIASGPALLEPNAQISCRDTALAAVMPAARPVTLVHVWPVRCQAPGPEPGPGAPKTQTFVGLSAVTPVSSGGRPVVVCGHSLATDHFAPL